MLYRFRYDDGTYYPRSEMQDVISKVQTALISKNGSDTEVLVKNKAKCIVLGKTLTLDTSLM